MLSVSAKLKIINPIKLTSGILLFIIIWQTGFLSLTALAQELPWGRSSLSPPEAPADPEAAARQAQTPSQTQQGITEQPLISIEDIGCGFRIGCYVKRVLAWLGYMILKISSFFLWLSSQVFDLSAALSLNYSAYSKNSATAIYEGWKLTRNFFNLFFIFIILVIAIAVILQISNYGSKEIIFRLVGVAILINFSFFMTQQIINLTNSVALYFYNPYRTEGLATIFYTKLDPQKIVTGYTIDPNFIFSKLGDVSFVDELNEEDLKKVVTQIENIKGKSRMIIDDACYPKGSQPTTEEGETSDRILKPNIEPCKRAVKEVLSGDYPEAQILKTQMAQILASSEIHLTSIIITALGGIVVVLTAAFILFAAAIMFMMRTVILWVLMMLAPFAFISYILPMTQSYSRQWWTRLFKEAFFAPTMMFMFYIVVMIINSDFLKKFAFSKSDNTALGSSFIFNYYLVSQYIFLLILLAMSLTVARSMGATGAGIAIKYGEKLRGFALGQAGRAGMYPARLAGRAALRYGAPAAEKFATAEGRIARTLRAIPGVGRGAREVVAAERKRVEDVKKEFSALTTKEALGKYEEKRMRRTATREDAMALTRLLAERPGDLPELQKSGQLKNIHNNFVGLGIMEDAQKIETYAPSLVSQRMKGKKPEEIEQAREKAIRKGTPDMMSNLLKMDEEFALDSANQKYYRQDWGESHLRTGFEAAKVDKQAEKNFGNVLNGMIEQYSPQNRDMNEVIEGLKKDNNYSAAKFLSTVEGENTFINLMKGREGYKEIKRGPAEVLERAKEARETLQLSNEQIKEKITYLVRPGAAEPDKELLKELTQALNFERLAAILNTLAETEQRQLAIMLKQKDPKQLERILNYNPKLLENYAATGKTMAEELGYSARNINNAVDYIKQIPVKDAGQISNEILMNENIILSLNKQQWNKIAESGNLTGKNIEKITDTISKQGSEELKEYFASHPVWQLRVTQGKAKTTELSNEEYEKKFGGWGI